MTPTVIWQPTDAQVETAAITAFARAVGQPETYPELWRWSTDRPAEFWRDVWQHFGVAGDPGPVFGEAIAMPGTQWFPDARLNYAAHLLGRRPDDRDALHHASETARRRDVDVGGPA